VQYRNGGPTPFYNQGKGVKKRLVISTLPATMWRGNVMRPAVRGNGIEGILSGRTGIGIEYSPTRPSLHQSKGFAQQRILAKGAFGTQRKYTPFAARAPGLAVSVLKYRRAKNDRCYAQQKCHREVDVVSS
jgi:hypothetical protein